MKVLAVDLAARYSAACLMDESGEVLWQFDSWAWSEEQFLSRVVSPWLAYFEPPIALVIEDLPHRSPYGRIVKAVCRLQGRILDRMSMLNALDQIVFVIPTVWRSFHKSLKPKTGPNAVVAVAEELGYRPPDYSGTVIKKPDKKTVQKVATDYCAAYLIARWAMGIYLEKGTLDVPGTSRYSTWERFNDA